MTVPTVFDAHAWAAAQLEVRPDAPRAEIREALRRHLADEDFVPSWSVQQAASLLLHPGDDAQRNLAQSQARLEEEQRLWAELDEFAGEFFDLPTEKRRQRWQELRRTCEISPLLVARLHALEPGLDVLPLEHAEADEAELARHICNLFMLRPAARAALRHSLLHRMREDVRRWKTAGRNLGQQAPAIARLMPNFCKYVAHDLAESSGNEVHVGSVRALAAASAAQSESGSSGSSGSSIGSSRLVWILIAVVLGLVRAATSFHGSSSPKYTPPPMTFPAEKLRWLQSDEERERHHQVPDPDFNEELKRREEIIRQLRKDWLPDSQKKKAPRENPHPDRPKLSSP